MPVSITPSLSSSSGYLVDVRDQVMSLIRFIIMNPGFTSSLWDEELISFRQLSSRYDYDPERLVSELSGKVSEVLHKKFKDYRFSVNFSTKSYDEESDDGRYTMVFDVIITSTPDESDIKQPAIISGRVNVDKNTNDISLIWDRSEDTASLLGGN